MRDRNVSRLLSAYMMQVQMTYTFSSSSRAPSSSLRSSSSLVSSPFSPITALATSSHPFLRAMIFSCGARASAAAMRFCAASQSSSCWLCLTGEGPRGTSPHPPYPSSGFSSSFQPPAVSSFHDVSPHPPPSSSPAANPPKSDPNDAFRRNSVSGTPRAGAAAAGGDEGPKGVAKPAPRSDVSNARACPGNEAGGLGGDATLGLSGCENALSSSESRALPGREKASVSSERRGSSPLPLRTRESTSIGFLGDAGSAGAREGEGRAGELFGEGDLALGGDVEICLGGEEGMTSDGEGEGVRAGVGSARSSAGEPTRLDTTSSNNAALALGEGAPHPPAISSSGLGERTARSVFSSGSEDVGLGGAPHPTSSHPSSFGIEDRALGNPKPVLRGGEGTEGRVERDSLLGLFGGEVSPRSGGDTGDGDRLAAAAWALAGVGLAHGSRSDGSGAGGELIRGMRIASLPTGFWGVDVDHAAQGSSIAGRLIELYME